VSRTLAALQERSGDTLTFGDEQAIISWAHGPHDKIAVDGLVATHEMHRQRMNQVMDGQRSGDAGDLVRAVSSRLVVVHDDADAVAEAPFAAEAFSLHPGTLYGLVQKWLEAEEEVGLEEWGVRALQDLGDADESGQSVYRWQPVQDREDVQGSVLVLVHPALAGYDPELGFVPDRSTGYRAKLPPPQATGQGGVNPYLLETYAEHARLVHRAFERQVWPELAPAAARLERVLKWPAGLIEEAAHLVALLHDAGKLNRRWQDWVRKYQRAIGRPAPAGLYAHTDFDPANPLHREQQRILGRKPSHAVEGAIAVAPLLAAALQQCEPLFNAAVTAIVRHHGAFTRMGQRYTLDPAAVGAVGETLSWLPPRISAGVDPAALWTCQNPSEHVVRDFLVDVGKDDEYLAYALLARALRRADQEGTSMGSRGSLHREATM
jgi:CRISPR-associated endonuclease Cas3-HD